MPVDKLIPYNRNARTHSEKQIKMIASSIVEFGFNDPIAIDLNNVIIAGHGRLQAAKLLGLIEVPTIQLGHLSRAQQKAYVLAHNRIALDAGWDEDLLKLELLELKDLDVDLYLTGFKGNEIKLTVDDLQIDNSDIEDKSETKIKECPKCGHQW